MDPPYDRIDAITDAAGAGFRLSLVLNAVKMNMQNADVEIQNISRAISDFSLMLKQVARTMEEGGGIQPTPLAIDTALDIKDHSERIFEEIKGMTELAQVRDDKGNLTEIGIGQKVVWCFKQQKVPYLLGQLDYLKLNLAIMLQILQLAKVVSPAKPRPPDKIVMQERAEIQNMIVLQHWSLEGLRTLFDNADKALRRDSNTSNGSEEPPPKYEDPPSEEVRLAVPAPPRPPKVEDTSKAIVKYQEQPIQQLDESLHRALSKENQALSAQAPDIVNHLLREWTIPDYGTQANSPQSRTLINGAAPSMSGRYRPTISSDEDESDDTDVSSKSHSRGYYLVGPAPQPQIKKKLRFAKQQAQVESDTEEEELHPRRRTKGRHILRSNESSDSDLSPPPARRRPLTSTDEPPPSSECYDRTRRPYTTGLSVPRNSPPEKEAVRIPQYNPRGLPQPPRQGPVPVGQPGHGYSHPQSQQGLNLRPPPPRHHSQPISSLLRRPSGSPYNPPQFMQSPGASPVMQNGQFFPQNQQRQPSGPMSPALGGPPGHWPPRERDRPPRPRSSHSQPSSNEGKSGRDVYELKGSSHGSDGRGGHESKRRDKKDASRNIKKGIGIGAAAAGLMELLSGLDAI